MQLAYTFSKSIEDTSDSLTSFANDDVTVQDPRDLRDNRGVSGFDVPHRIVLTHVWELPWGKNADNPIVRRLASGWGFSGISQWRSGFPVAFESGPRLNIANPSVITTGGFIRPNASRAFSFNPLPAGSAGAPQGLNDDSMATRRISAYAASLGLTQPLLGHSGTLGRNTHRLNGFVNFDWNVYRTIPVTEQVAMKLRCEIYNVFNHHSFRNVTRNIASPGFGQYTTLGQSQRILQLAVIVEF